MEQTQINKFYHAILNEVLRSGKKINIRGRDYSASLDTFYANYEQLKMFIKMSDVSYPKTSNRNYKNVFGRDNDDIFSFFGNPISMKDISLSDFIRHVEWLEFVCNDNGIKYKQKEA